MSATQPQEGLVPESYNPDNRGQRRSNDISEDAQAAVGNRVLERTIGAQSGSNPTMEPPSKGDKQPELEKQEETERQARINIFGTSQWNAKDDEITEIAKRKVSEKFAKWSRELGGKYDPEAVETAVALQRAVGNITALPKTQQQAMAVEPTRTLKKVDLSSYEGRKEWMKQYTEVAKNGYITKDIRNFMGNPNIKTDLTSDGRIVISGLELKIPDLANEYKEQYKNDLNEIGKIFCYNTKFISGWNRRAICVLAVVIAIMITMIILYAIYRSWFSD